MRKVNIKRISISVIMIVCMFSSLVYPCGQYQKGSNCVMPQAGSCAKKPCNCRVSSKAVKDAVANGDMSSEALAKQAWDAYNKGDYKTAAAFSDKIVELYGEEAVKQQSSMKGFASKGKESEAWALNDVATALFIKADSAAKSGDKKTAKENYERILNEFSYAQCYDPSYDGYWQVAKGAQESLAKLK